MDIGEKMKVIRKEKGLKQADVARDLETSQSYISAVENGRTVPTARFIKLFFLQYKAELAELEVRLEDKKQIVEGLKHLLRETRAGSGIVDMVLDDDETMVTVLYEGGSKRINVDGDSGIALIKDVIKRI